MRKVTMLFIVLLVLISCKNDDDTIINPEKQNKVLLLKIDFETYILEEGKELVFETDKDFEIATQYVSPGDFGSVTLLYKDTDEKIFSGTIIWTGTGEIEFPENFIKPSDFQRCSNPVKMPDISTFLKVMYDDSAYYPDIIDYQKIWNEINTLALLKEYRLSNPEAKINILLYTPSVGILDPSAAGWIVIVKN